MPASLRELLRRQEVREVATIQGPLGVMALHGGIEPPTYTIAREVAGATDASLYAVVQPEARSNEGHLTSTLYSRSESRLLDAFLDRVVVVMSVHGMNRRGMNDQIALGGRNRPLAARLGSVLRGAGFDAIDELEAIPSYLRGTHPDNPVNIPPSGGVQLEIGRDLRLDRCLMRDLTKALAGAAKTLMADLPTGR